MERLKELLSEEEKQIILACEEKVNDGEASDLEIDIMDRVQWVLDDERTLRIGTEQRKGTLALAQQYVEKSFKELKELLVQYQEENKKEEVEETTATYKYSSVSDVYRIYPYIELIGKDVEVLATKQCSSKFGGKDALVKTKKGKKTVYILAIGIKEDLVEGHLFASSTVESDKLEDLIYYAKQNHEFQFEMEGTSDC